MTGHDKKCARSSTDRASDYGSEGSGFESLRAHKLETVMFIKLKLRTLRSILPS